MTVDDVIDVVERRLRQGFDGHARHAPAAGARAGAAAGGPAGVDWRLDPLWPGRSDADHGAVRRGRTNDLCERRPSAARCSTLSGGVGIVGAGNPDVELAASATCPGPWSRADQR